MADQGEHGIDRFDQHPVVPGAPWTDLKVGRIALPGMEARVTQDQHPILKDLDQGVKQGIVDVGRCRRPAELRAGRFCSAGTGWRRPLK